MTIGEIFTNASNIVNEYTPYMCVNINWINEAQDKPSKFSFADFEKRGFTRENYHRYIMQYYPSLVKDLLDSKYSAWIRMPLIRSFPLSERHQRILASKRNFLRYLAQ